MSDTKDLVFLAVDLGAESGRVVAGHLNGERITLDEVHRFPNGPVRVQDYLHWDVLRLWSDIKVGLTKAAQAYGDRIAGIGLDTWGVDFGLLASDDTLLGNPFHYRDPRTDGVMDRVFERIPRGQIFQTTGIQFMQLNTLYQLFAMVEAKSPILSAARTFLMMPDLLNFWLTGHKSNEFSVATTTQFYNPVTSTWAYDLLDELGIPTRLFGQGRGRLVMPGTVLGLLSPSVAADTGLPQVPVIAPATHDTASAVAATPMEPENAIYISSGTWSLIGVEVKVPIINEEMLACNFTNEGGVDGTFRLLKNIMGLWLVQECRREWQRSGDDYDYDALTQMADEAPAFGAFIAPGDDSFLAPGDMQSRIAAFCERTGQPAPESRGAMLRTILESLALEYRWVVEKLDELTGKGLETIHVIGGGSQNMLLNQFTANATNRKVVIGPVEATALGNVLVQAIALGHIRNIHEGRWIIGQSSALRAVSPHDKDSWDAAYERYVKIRSAIP
ncbi:MAG: rhamnulokinase [Anaerolineae bacterium]|nr:rhamnulokinase [Anaerolineae bacterium]